MADKKAKDKTTKSAFNDGTLKRRNSDGTTARVVKKRPNKMNLVKPKRMASPGTDQANPSNLVFPTDVFGLTTELRKAVIKAAAKVGTDKEKVELVEETIRVLRVHLQSVHKANVANGPLKTRGAAGELLAVEATEDEAEGTQEGSTDEPEATEPKPKATKKKKAKK